MQEQSEISEVEKLRKMLQHNLRVYDATLREKRREMKDKEEEILALRGELEKFRSLKKEKDELSERLVKAEEALREAQEKLAKAGSREELEQLKAKFSERSAAAEKLDAELKDLNDAYKKLQAEIEILRGESEARKKLDAEAQRLRSELEEKLSEKSQLINNLKAELVTLKKQNEERASKLKEREEAAQLAGKLRTEAEALKSQISALKKTALEAESRASEAAKELERLRSELKQREDEVMQAFNAFKGEKAKKEQLEQKLREQMEKNAALEEKVKKKEEPFLAEIRNLSAKLGEVNQIKSALEAEREALKKQLENSNSALQVEKERAAKLEQKAKELEDVNAKLRAEFESSSSALAELEKRLKGEEKLRRELETKTQSAEKMWQELKEKSKLQETLEAQLQSMQEQHKGEVEELREALAKVQAELSEKAKLLDNLKLELENKNDAMKSLQSSSAALEAQVSSFKEERQKLSGELEEKLKLVESLQTELKAKEKLGVEIEILKRYNDEKKAKITELENLLAERSRALAEKEAVVQDIEAKRERVRNLVIQASAKRKEAPSKDALDAFLEHHQMRMNPFQDKIVSPEVFINKDSEALQRVLRAAKHNQSSLSFLIGPTGSGKSENADFIVRSLPENYIFWYNQVYGQSAKELAISILGDIDEKFRESLRDKMREEVISTFNLVLAALLRDNKKLLCIFDQGEHFSRDAMEFIINSTNPHYASNRAFTALVLAVPRLERKLNKLMENYDTALKRALIREYMCPFSPSQRVEYIVRALAVSRGKSYEELVASRELAPFTEEAVNALVEISRGHPNTLADLCYTSMEIASLVAKDAKVEEETVKEAWAKYPNKALHEEAVKWYEGKGLYLRF